MKHSIAAPGHLSSGQVPGGLRDDGGDAVPAVSAGGGGGRPDTCTGSRE